MEELTRKQDVEVRILIKNVQDIAIFRDMGARNDVHVEGTLITEDYYGRTHTQVTERACASSYYLAAVL